MNKKHIFRKANWFTVDTFEAKGAKAAAFLERIKARMDDDDDRGHIIGYASVFEKGPDLHGDIIAHGAFTKTINERIANGMVPLLDGHQDDSAHVLGRVVDAIEDDHGLLIHAVLSKAPSVQDVRVKLMDGTIDGLSIGYETVRYSVLPPDEKANRTYWRLEEIKLFEISAVPIPAREDARITLAKSLAVESAPAIQEQEESSELKSLLDKANEIVVNSDRSLIETMKFWCAVEKLSDGEQAELFEKLKKAEPVTPLTDHASRLDRRSRALKFKLEN